jgi:GTP-binding protein
MPNSGKTRLLDKLTHAKAKVELYPFSTQSPQLGIYEAQDYSHISLCDLPAICEGASEGKGLGNRFLKHLERSRLIFYILDPLGNFSVDLRQSYNILLNEVSKFNSEFRDIPHFVVINKIDIEEVREKAEKEKSKFRDRCFLVSAETGEGIKELMKAAEKELGL